MTTTNCAICLTPCVIPTSHHNLPHLSCFDCFRKAIASDPLRRCPYCREENIQVADLTFANEESLTLAQRVKIRRILRLPPTLEELETLETTPYDGVIEAIDSKNYKQLHRLLTQFPLSERDQGKALLHAADAPDFKAMEKLLLQGAISLEDRFLAFQAIEATAGHRTLKESLIGQSRFAHLERDFILKSRI